MSQTRRMYRVAGAVKEVLAKNLPLAADDRFHRLTITSVVVSKDLRIAKVYWVGSDSDDARKEMEQAFQKAGGYFRKLLAEELQLRYVPELRFYYDSTLDTIAEIDNLLEKTR